MNIFPQEIGTFCLSFFHGTTGFDACARELSSAYLPLHRACALCSVALVDFWISSLEHLNASSFLPLIQKH